MSLNKSKDIYDYINTNIASKIKNKVNSLKEILRATYVFHDEVVLLTYFIRFSLIYFLVLRNPNCRALSFSLI